jgi:bifunctional non-homologous end joining protein LigD
VAAAATGAAGAAGAAGAVGELIAAGKHGEPDFLALLHGRHVPTCVYCFDLLELNGRNLREQPLVQRRARLQALLARAKCKVIRFSEAFPDPHDLLAECARLGLEGRNRP